MNIERVNSYRDQRFSQAVLNQHGCFLVDGDPYEVEILSQREAVIRGREERVFPDLIEEFRFYTPHISVFYDENRKVVKDFPPLPILKINLKDVQPSQFYVDQDKINAIQDFIWTGEDIIIQVLKHGDRYISLDGHTRLYYAAIMGWTETWAVEAASEDYIFDFVKEAINRNIWTPYDLQLVDHKTYEQNWNQFCDDYFACRESEQ